MIITFEGKVPKIGNNVFIAPDAWIIGDVELGDNVSVFFGCVLRGDIMPIRIGNGSNIQEHTVIHTTTSQRPVEIGEYVTIGHRVVIHSASVQDYALVGMGSVLLDNSVIEKEAVLGAASLLTENKTIQSGHLAVGSPAKVVRPLNSEEKIFLRYSAEHYIEKGEQYRRLFAK